MIRGIKLYEILNLLVEHEIMYRVVHQRIPRIQIIDNDTGYVYIKNKKASEISKLIFDSYDLYMPFRHAVVRSYAVDKIFYDGRGSKVYSGQDITIKIEVDAVKYKDNIEMIKLMNL